MNRLSTELAQKEHIESIVKQLNMCLVDHETGEILYKYHRELPVHPLGKDNYPMRDAIIRMVDCALRGINQGKPLTLDIAFNRPNFSAIQQKLPF